MGDHDDAVTWKPFPHNWPILSRLPVDSAHKGPVLWNIVFFVVLLNKLLKKQSSCQMARDITVMEREVRFSHFSFGSWAAHTLRMLAGGGLNHWADIVVVAVYFVLVLAVGLWVRDVMQSGEYDPYRTDIGLCVE